MCVWGEKKTDHFECDKMGTEFLFFSLLIWYWRRVYFHVPLWICRWNCVLFIFFLPFCFLSVLRYSAVFIFSAFWPTTYSSINDLKSFSIFFIVFVREHCPADACKYFLYIFYFAMLNHFQVITFIIWNSEMYFIDKSVKIENTKEKANKQVNRE